MNFNGDFSVVCKNMHILLTGKARDWFWRYHKQVESIVWTEFCEALRFQYRDFKSSFDIREEIRNRKQKPNETFDEFFDAITVVMDKLPHSMSEGEVIEILTRNLRPEIRQDLLYIPIHSLPHLRKLVQMRENFLADEHVRKNLSLRNQNPNVSARRYVNELDFSEKNSDNFVEAFERSENKSCWNCQQIGHHWHDCLADRTVFCYGCGTKDVYKPKCIKCQAKKQNISKNLTAPGPQIDLV